MNRATLIGNVGADPEIRSTQGGKKIANFRVATSERWRDKESGERKEKSEWHSIVSFNEGITKIVEQYVKKGSKVCIEGKIVTRKWKDQSGNDRYSTEIHLDFDGKIHLLSSAPGSDRGGDAGGGGRGRDEEAIPFSAEFR